MKKLLFITPRIEGAGGVQKFLSIRTRYLVSRYDYRVHILVTNATTEENFYDFRHVKVTYIEIPGRGLTYFVKYVGMIRKHMAATRPDVTLIVDNGKKGYLLPRFIKTADNRIIFEQHGYRFYRDLENKNTLVNRLKHRGLNFLIEKSMAKADWITVLTPANKKEWKFENISVMPNPLPQEYADLPALQATQKTVIAVGRYAYEKGFDMLLEVWAEVVKAYPDWALKFYGDSDGTIDLQAQVDRLGLQTSVQLNAAVPNIREKYRAAQVFLMSSRHEGFGNVLIEAMACGLPCVAFDCPTGPGFIINDCENGFLVPPFDRAAYAERVKQLLADEEQRRKLGRHAQESVKRFAPDQVMMGLHQLLQSV